MTGSTKVADYCSLLREVVCFVRERKSLWLAPVIFTLLMFGALFFFLEGSVVAPAIYTLF
jgi:hypothetical protein